RFGGGVGRGIHRALQSALRGDVDDAALPARGHRRVDRLRHEEHALQVHRDDPVELRLAIGFEGLADVHAGIVEQDVDRPELARRRAGEGPAGRDIGDIDRAVQGAPAERPDLISGFVGLGIVSQMAKGDVRALGGECQRRGAADPARAAGDQCDFSRKLHAVLPAVGPYCHRMTATCDNKACAAQRSLPMTVIDSQVHVYEANTPKRPWHTVPNWPPHVTGDEMVAAMDKVGVDGAIFISAFSMYRYDASYAVEVQRGHPGRFAIVKPVDPDDPAVGDIIAEWEQTPVAIGIRIIMMTDSKRTAKNPGRGRIVRAAVQLTLHENVMCCSSVNAHRAM